MSEWKFNHFSDLGHLLAAATYVVISNEFCFVFICPLDRFSLVEESCLGRYNTILGRVDIYNLEFNSFEATTNNESITLLDWTVAVLKVRD
jgi:hypothetical protein